jgi:hypothetical protein
MPTEKEPRYILAHKHSAKHRVEMEASDKCGCFYCLSIFSPSEILDWLKEGDGTALCPRCGIDSVIGSRSGYPITDFFLREMNRYWFSTKS